MGNVVGLVAASAIAIALFNLQTLVHVSPEGQLVAVAATMGANLVAWRTISIPPMSPVSAIKRFSFGLALVVGLALLDVLIGFAAGAKSIAQAFVHSGAFGGIVDGLMAALLLLIGVPTLIRAVWLHRQQQSVGAVSDA